MCSNWARLVPLRTAIVVIVLLAGIPFSAFAEKSCYSTITNNAPKTKWLRFPRILILLDKPAEGFVQRKSAKALDWIEGPDKTYFKGESGDSFWMFDNDRLIITIGSGFDGIRISLSESMGGYEGTAENHSDGPMQPGTKPDTYEVKLQPVTCPGP
jgi:hypothetical protein